MSVAQPQRVEELAASSIPTATQATGHQPQANDAEAPADGQVQRGLIEHAVTLLSQQIWCWGQDVERSEGNWLLQQGFERHPPPPELKDCPSVYLLRLPDGRNVVLRGFGLFYGCTGVGGIFLPRYKFTPKFSECANLQSPPWDDTGLPSFQEHSDQNRDACKSLLLELVYWLHRYEADIAKQLGVAYREHTLTKWNDGKRRTVPAVEFAASWNQLAERIDQDFDDLFNTSSNRG